MRWSQLWGVAPDVNGYPMCACGRYLMVGVDLIIDRERNRHERDRCQPARESIP